ncbi:NAD(P)H-dependent glycerol-3-phosphate dehydrogenase [Elusimicrobiota bacterium]
MKNIGILGAGSWGATIASLLCSKGHKVTLWEFDKEAASEFAKKRVLSFFPGLKLSNNISITNNLKESVEKKDIIFLVVPSHTMRDVSKQVSLLGIDLKDTIIVSATKGIENNSLKRMSEVIAEEISGIGNRVVALSGPTHAEEVSKKIPTTVTVASKNMDAAKQCQNILMEPYFRVYTNPDIVGVETGGALKNIFAIASGISDGLGLGDNSKAAIVTRGLRELVKLGTKMGGKQITFFGLSGVGDLIVTCFSKHSRNRAIGEKIGSGKSIEESEKELIMVAEGVKTTQSAYDLGKKHGLDLPIIQQVYNILYKNKSPKEALNELMMRDAKPEIDLYEYE